MNLPPSDTILALMQAWLLQATAVGLLVWVICRLCRHLPATFRYALIGIALVKFAVPPVVSAPFSLFDRITTGSVAAPIHGEEARRFLEAPPGPPGTEVPLLGSRRVSSRPMSAPATPSGPDTAAPARVDAATGASLSRMAWLGLFYAMGVLVAAAILIREAWRLRQWVRSARPASTALALDYARIAAQLGLARTPRLRVSTQVDSPLSLGAWSPCILLPRRLTRSLSSEDLSTVLAHELLHHRHADLPVNLLVSLLTVLWWFHPVMRLLSGELRHAQEDWCDDALVRRRITSGEAYCGTLLQVARNLRPTSARKPALAVAMALPPHALERRFRRLLNPGWKGRVRMNRPLKLLVVLSAAALLPGARTLSSTPAVPADPSALWVQDVEDGFAPEGPAKVPLVFPGEDLVIRLDQNGAITVAGKPVSAEVFRATVEWALKADPKRKILLEAHEDCPVGAMVQAFTAVQDAGGKNVKVGAATGARGDGWSPEDIQVMEEPAPLPAGTSKATAGAIQAGLDWLKKHQHPDGYWDADGFSERCKDHADCNGQGDALHDVGVTAMALLAFLGEGNTVNAGPHKETVRMAAKYLMSIQDPEDGCFGSKAGQHFTYNHALATLALVETCHLSGLPQLREPVQKAVDFIHKARNPYKAWRYAMPPDGDNDVSVTGWMMYALLAAKDAGFVVDPQALQGGMSFVQEMTDPATGRTGYHERGSPPAREPSDIDQWPSEQSESLTALGLLLRLLSGESPEKNPELMVSATLLTRKLPDWSERRGTIDFYYWYYGTYASWQMGGRHWQAWQGNLVKALLPHQRSDGGQAGSWDPQVDPWGDKGGRVYSTALNVLALEASYRYDRIMKKDDPD